MYFVYNFLTKIFFPLSPLYLKYRQFKKKENATSFKEKMSIATQKKNEGFLVWFHAASVGEALSVLPIIQDLEKEEKIKTILITTITLSSAQVLKKRLNKSEKIIHQFLPLDIRFFIKKFLNNWSPNISIFVDSEIWPNLIKEIKYRKISLLLINGRITKKSFLRWKMVKNFSNQIFSNFDLCISSDKKTSVYLEQLGVKNIKNYGNLKFANTKYKKEDNLNTSFVNKFQNRKVWCAASTHDTEEDFCAKTHIKIKKKFGSLLTIIIPRHINRINKIYKDLSNLNLKVKFYSKFEEIDDTTDILLVDTYGDVLKFYKLAKYVFLGKSMISSIQKDSGQNPIEASKFGCKIFHGPYVSNFFEIYEELKNLGFTKKISNSDELAASLIKEFESNKSIDNESIKKIENYGQNILENYLREIKIYINI